MSGDSVDLNDRRSLTWQPIAQLLFILVIASCTAGPGRGSPTPPALPSIPAITPIGARREPSAVPQASPTPSPTVEPTRETDSPTVHVVEPGDTLLGLAQQYEVPMAAIQLQNEMGASTVVQAGRALTIPSQDEWEGANPFWVIHEVKPSETLIGIARTYDLEVDRLQTVNGLDDADRITVGQQLVLPLGGPAAAPVLRATDHPLPTASAPPTATPRPTPASDAGSGLSIAPASTSEALPPTDLTFWPQEIARLINDVRAEHSLPPLDYHRKLEQAAQAHANDCAQRGWCSHMGSDGASIKTRILRTGYDAAGWAECWAQTQTPRKAVEIWMNETPPNDPHRRTLLSDWLTEVGLGVSEADWGYYIIADFGRP
jgi:uncharacterized protein YkwD